MKKMFEYDLVRRMYYHENLSRREISRRTGYHRKTITKMLRYSQPRGYQRAEPARKPKIGAFTGIIDEMLESDRRRPRKQRHTAKRIYERLVEEHGFAGGYTIVKDYVRAKRVRMKEVFFPLEQRPGTSQIDFGTAQVILAGKKQDAHIFCMGLPYSDAFFIKAYPNEALEAVQDGHVSAYSFFGGVPPQALYDNMSTAVKRVCRHGMRELTDGFLALRSHYLFQSCFCNVARANEKGVVEGLIGFVRRNFLVPLPRFRDWTELNAYLESAGWKRYSQKAAGQDKTIGERLEEEKQRFLPLPPAPFEACRMESRQVTSLSLVQFQHNHYSVPIRYAYREVILKAFVDRVVICWKNETIACHQRSYARHEYIFDPLHYLPLLERKPGALDGGLPFSGWELPGGFSLLRRLLESRNGPAGTREYIQVLQLLRDFKISEVSRALDQAFRYRCLNFEAIKMLVLSGRDSSIKFLRLSGERLERLPRICIASSDPSQYRMLLAGGVS
jgi:transposase